MVIDLVRKITQKMERLGRRGLKYDQKKKQWAEAVGNGGGFYWRRRSTVNCSAGRGGRGRNDEVKEEQILGKCATFIEVMFL
jgi:hypothetical protein